MSKKKNKKNDFFSNYYIYMIVVFIIVFSICIISIFKNSKKYDINPLLLNSNYDVVYQVDNVPVINLVGTGVDEINSEIEDYYENNNNNDRFEYEYDISEDTFSLLIKRYIIVDNKEFIEYKSYNIDLNTMEKLEFEDLLNKFEIEYSDLSFFVKNKFLNYYMDLLDKGYFKNNKCDFDCFIENCNFQDYMEDNVYYIKNNHLYLYKFFNIYTEYNYNDFFTYDSFIFEIK